MRIGGRIPDSIKNAPTLLLGLQLFLDAWLDLNTCRQVGFNTGPIPWLAIHQWANVHELDLEQRDQLHLYMPAMDATYFEWIERQRSKK